MITERQFVSLKPRPATVYFEDFRYRGKIHCYRDIRMLDEMNKTDRRFLPLTDVEMLHLTSEDPLRTLDYIILGKSRIDFVVIETVEAFHPVGVTPEDEKVAVILGGFKLQGTLRRQKSFRPVDELNRPNANFFDLHDVTVFLSRQDKLIKVASENAALVNKSRVGMLIPLETDLSSEE